MVCAKASGTLDDAQLQKRTASNQDAHAWQQILYWWHHDHLRCAAKQQTLVASSAVTSKPVRILAVVFSLALLAGYVIYSQLKARPPANGEEMEFVFSSSKSVSQPVFHVREAVPIENLVSSPPVKPSGKKTFWNRLFHSPKKKQVQAQRAAAK